MTTTTNKILIVDDDLDFAESLADLLEPQGHSITIATSGAAAIQRVTDQKFDLVFLDIKMPGIDGVETLRRLHDLQEHLKVAVVTGYATSEQLDEAVLAGAFAVLGKPCPIETLLDVAKRARCEQIVLVADDDPDFAAALVETLSTSGRRVLTSGKGASVLNILEEERVNALLLDFRLADADGVEVLTALRDREISVPVIALTTYAREDEELSRFGQAVAEVIRKPVPARRLVEAVNQAVRKTPREDIERLT